MTKEIVRHLTPFWYFFYNHKISASLSFLCYKLGTNLFFQILFWLSLLWNISATFKKCVWNVSELTWWRLFQTCAVCTKFDILFYLLYIVMSCLRFTVSDFPIGIFKLSSQANINAVIFPKRIPKGYWVVLNIYIQISTFNLKLSDFLNPNWSDPLFQNKAALLSRQMKLCNLIKAVCLNVW